MGNNPSVYVRFQSSINESNDLEFPFIFFVFFWLLGDPSSPRDPSPIDFRFFDVLSLVFALEDENERELDDALDLFFSSSVDFPCIVSVSEFISLFISRSSGGRGASPRAKRRNTVHNRGRLELEN